MTEIPETVLAQAKAYVRANHGSTAGWSEVIARAIMDERERAARYTEGISHQGLHESMWRNMFQRVADGIRRGDT